MHHYGPLATLAASCLWLGVAPLVMPDSYSWIEHGVSESGAQLVPHAWVARAGFVLLGAAALWLAAQPAIMDVVVFVVALLVPLAGSAPIWGLLQRTTFAGAYVWFANEAAAHNRDARRPG